jgi:uncharacterized Zn-finger protein
MKIILYILAAITIFFGVLFIWGAFDPSSPDGWIIVGVISVAIGLGLIWLAGRQKAKAGDKCQSCGGALTPENVKLVAGAPVVTCPYCNTSYQLKEEPKW